MWDNNINHVYYCIRRYFKQKKEQKHLLCIKSFGRNQSVITVMVRTPWAVTSDRCLTDTAFNIFLSVLVSFFNPVFPVSLVYFCFLYFVSVLSVIKCNTPQGPWRTVICSHICLSVNNAVTNKLSNPIITSISLTWSSLTCPCLHLC